MTPIEVVEAIYEAFTTADLDRVLELCHDDVVVTQDDRIPYGGRYEGRDGVATFAINLVATIESNVEHLALFEADGHVWQYGRTIGRVRANGAPFEIAEVHRWTVRDGLVVEAAFAIDTPAMLAAIAAPGPTPDDG